jgi:glycosyltransferase involved in cell wall biosynthesis
MGPKDVVANGSVGFLGDDLREAALAALELDRKECRSYAELFSWASCARRFSDIIAEANSVQHASQFRNETDDIAL